MNFSLHSYKFFPWSQSYPGDLKATAIKKWQYFPTGCFSTYFHVLEGYALDLALWNGIGDQEKTVQISLYITEYGIIKSGLFKNPLLFQAKLSVCHAVVSCHKTVITVFLMWQCWGHWQSFLAWWCSDFAWQTRLLQWKSHGSSATMWELPCLSLLMSSNTILTSGYIPTPFEVSAVYSLTVDLSYLIICWAIILSTPCCLVWVFFFFSEKCWEMVCITLSVYQNNEYAFPSELCIGS